MHSVNTVLVGLATCLLLTSTGDGETTVNRTIDCLTAREECENDFQCAYRLYKVFKILACGKPLGYDIRTGQVTGAADKVCPSVCAIAIYNLTSLAKGKMLQSCECINRDSICLTLKARLAKCMNTFINGPSNDSKPGCSEVRQQCSNNKACNAAQLYFLRKCGDLISGVECTKDCKRTQIRLLALPLGRGMNQCECDGYEEPHCRGIRAHQKALCFGTRVTKSVTPKYRPTRNVQRVGSGSREGVDRVQRLGLYSVAVVVVWYSQRYRC